VDDSHFGCIVVKKKTLNIMVMFDVVVDMDCWYNIKVYSLVMHLTIALQKKQH
jgi:hypothetical protein